MIVIFWEILTNNTGYDGIGKSNWLATIVTHLFIYIYIRYAIEWGHTSQGYLPATKWAVAAKPIG